MSWFFDPAWTPLASWLEAIGTILAVVVALFLPSIKNWWNRPQINVEFNNEEPYCRVAIQPLVSRDGTQLLVNVYFMRIKIINHGRSTAKKCEGKIVEIKFQENNTSFTPFDPVVIKWVGHHPGPIQINKGEYEFLDVVSVSENMTERIRIGVEDPTPRGINFTPPMNDYSFHISIYGDNFSPKKVSFSFNGNAQFDQVTLTRI